MAWSKTQENSAGVWFKEGNDALYGVSGLDHNKVAFGEIVSWLVSRGWVIEGQDLSAVGEGTIYWDISKEFVTIDGGTRKYGWRIQYVGDADNYDKISFYGYDFVTGGPYGTGTSDDVWEANYDMNLHGVWTMWQSDQDADSYLLINKTNGVVMGFMPPSGTLFNYGVSSFPRVPVETGFLPFGSNGLTYTATQLYDLYVGYTSQSNINYLASPVPYKLDYVMLTNSIGYPLATINGGDMSSMLNFSAGPQVRDQGTVSDSVATLLLDGEYYIAWGEDSQILFNVGTNSPVY